MDFKQLQSFVAVVRYESFTKAATRLGVSQPTISTHVRMLEEELGISLVLRTSKHVELTPQGRKVYEQAVGVLAMRDRMVDVSKCRESNTIYLGASSIPSAYVLPTVIPAYSEKNSKSHFVIYQGDSQEVLNALEEGIYDVGLVGMNADIETLECIAFARDRLVLVTPYSEQFEGAASSLEALKNTIFGNNLVLRREGSASRSLIDHMFDEYDVSETDLNVTARINDQETIKNLVESGYGITILSERAVADRVKEGRLMAHPLPRSVSERNLYVAYRKNALTDEVRDFVTFVRMSYAHEM